MCLATLGLGSCNQQPVDPEVIEAQKNNPEPGIPSTPTVSEDLASAYTNFALKLFSQIHEEQAKQNIFISPVSITNALAMTYNGAEGATQQAIAETLELRGFSLREVNQANAALNELLDSGNGKVKLTIANSLWLNKNASFKPDFLQQVNEYYDAELNQLSFSDRSASSEINNWVNQKTNGKIKRIVNQLDSDTILYLINAIYFKGTWSDPFSKNATQEQPFTLLDGTQKQHPLMSKSGQYRYLETDRFQAISLPYAEGRLSMYVFLPKSDVGLENFYQSLSMDRWQTWINEFRPQGGSIKLPRFKMEYDIGLNDILKEMGMEIAFIPQSADFSKMTSEKDAHISEVKHKTFVEVNEEGTEAAASTSVGVTTTSAPIDPPFEMVVDRPFFFVIRDNQTGTLLFMGSIVNPTQS